MIFTGLLLPILKHIFFKKEFESVNILLCECMKYTHDLCWLKSFSIEAFM